MRELLELTKDFQVSRPVFRLTMGRNENRISASDPIYQYRPKPEENNILSELVCDAYREVFDVENGVFVIDKEAIAGTVMNSIRRSMAAFLEENLDMRSPTQSKLYRWFDRNLPDSYYFNDLWVMVYKYMRQHTHENMREIDASTGENKEQIANIIALMEAIMEKHA